LRHFVELKVVDRANNAEEMLDGLAREVFRLPRLNQIPHVLHLGAALPHETTLHSKKTLRASPRSVALRLIAEQTSSSGFLKHSQ